MTHEIQIENTFIGILTERENQWSYRSDIKTEAALWENLRGHINRINIAQLDGISLTDSEFAQLKNEFRLLTQTPFLASQWLRGENGIAQITIERGDNSKGNVTLTLFSNRDIAGGISSYEVVNQIVPETFGRAKRGDVTLLINGLPVIHIELKSEYAKDGYYQAFDQMKRYAQTGFFDGIFATVQIMVISNKVATKYFARPSSNHDFKLAKKFLFNWREENNTPVEDLFDFTRVVLSIPMAHELISRYTILVDDKKALKFMMVLRPYQIHAIKKIGKQASAREGGFIWHATGSGKTITSFVATKLLAQSAVGVARTVMIVDRKDLDSQTKNEFSKFASEYNTGLTSGDVTDNTLIVGIDNKRELVDNLLSKKNNNTIIVTTIQKLSRAIRDFYTDERKTIDEDKN
ncbi:MAG: DEAD/DEAH box helicase family protein, partial [Defluviitaleaceae bacterium]|nr:DEAD/DEAH box helicase family protein [Defluviitaleaceae bacterium]